MGRPPKYKTDEERHEARKKARRDYYKRNTVWERTRALQRYHSKVERGRSARVSQPRERYLSDVLPRTVAALGLPIMMEEAENLKVVVEALDADFCEWLQGRAEPEVWEALTTRLIAAFGRSRIGKLVLKEINDKRLIVNQAHEYAELAYREAWNRGRAERRNAAALERLAHRTLRVAEGLREIVELYETGEKTLHESYIRRELVWQSTA